MSDLTDSLKGIVNATGELAGALVAGAGKLIAGGINSVGQYCEENSYYVKCPYCNYEQKVIKKGNALVRDDSGARQCHNCKREFYID